MSERDIRRIQIRETIKAHFDKEKQLFAQGIKVLSLFFIDEVVKYRDYARADEKGEYARVFEEEYGLLKAEYLAELAMDNENYRKHSSTGHRSPRRMRAISRSTSRGDWSIPT